MKRIFTLFFLVIVSYCSSQQPTIAQLKKDIFYLSSDELQGRATGTPEERKAALYISQRFKKLKLIPMGRNNSYLYPFSFKKTIHVHDTSGGTPSSGMNVAAFLNNRASNTIIIGAHFDHLGLGKDGNSLDSTAKGSIHNGADDNASGTAGVIALAEYFATNQRKEKFNFLFICFSGEELGLIGSKKFCEQPTIDFSTVNYMINMDMIGRLNDSTKKLIIYGVGTAKEWVTLIDKLPGYFSVKTDSSGIGPSDQTSFYLKNIPVLHFFTGQHNDYHKPGDDYSKINFEGEKEILNYIIRLIAKTEELPKLEFQQTKNPNAEIRNFKVTMGVMPDYTFEGTGMRIDGVIEGRAASKAGIEKGDIVIKMDDRNITNLNDYMKALHAFDKGQTIQLVVIRNETELKLNLTF